MFDLMMCEKTLLDEIANPDLKKRDVAQTYALAIGSQEHRDGLVDWKKVNAAITDKWGLSGLRRVKEQAWLIVYREGHNHLQAVLRRGFSHARYAD